MLINILSRYVLVDQTPWIFLVSKIYFLHGQALEITLDLNVKNSQYLYKNMISGWRTLPRGPPLRRTRPQTLPSSR